LLKCPIGAGEIRGKEGNVVFFQGNFKEITSINIRFSIPKIDFKKLIQLPFMCMKLLVTM
jgi:hypothetical protein